jgi:regulator of chromosome condensation
MLTSRRAETATKPARKAPAKKPAASSSATASAPAPSRKRKAPDDAEASDEARHTKTAALKAAQYQDAQQPKRKRGRPARVAPAAPRVLNQVLNQAPTQILAVYAFGTGDCGELGLGSRQNSALSPLLNKFLDPMSPDGLRVVQLACGGMHVVALTEDNKIVTWGVNDKGALGRDTTWEGKLRDMDAEESEEDDADESEDDDADLNPLESTPTALPEDAFPPGTVLVQVAAGDSCSLALADTGLVYGWGTFLVSYFSGVKASLLTQTRVATASPASSMTAPASSSRNSADHISSPD